MQKLQTTVLIVEDDLANGQVLVLELAQFAFERQAEYSLLLAETGAQAFHLAQETPPDLCLLDYHLPGMNGLQFYELLCASVHKKIPALIITALSLSSERLPSGVQILSKPYGIDEFFSHLENLLPEANSERDILPL